MYSIAEQFAAHLCGRVSTGTSRAYLSDVNGFLQAISFAGNTDAITDGAVEAYLGALREQGLKPATLNRKVFLHQRLCQIPQTGRIGGVQPGTDPGVGRAKLPAPLSRIPLPR